MLMPCLANYHPQCVEFNRYGKTDNTEKEQAILELKPLKIRWYKKKKKNEAYLMFESESGSPDIM